MTATVSAFTTGVQRLKGKFEAVWDLMKDGQWHTAGQIRLVGGSEGLRRLREMRDFCLVEKRHLGNGMYEYRAR